MHSAYSGTSHRGQVITSLHGLPVQFTPTQEAMNQPPACPDWHDHREHIDGTMPSAPGEVHRVYAAGKLARQFPKVIDRGNDLGLQAANIYAGALKQAAADNLARAEITVDPWCPVVSFSDAHTTRREPMPDVDVYGDPALDGWEVVPYDDEAHSPV